MLSAKLASLRNAVAKPSSALGATSWMISSIAVPSSPPPASPGRTSTAGSSPRCLGCGERGDTVGQRADLHADAGDADLLAGGVRVVRAVAFAVDRAGAALQCRLRLLRDAIGRLSSLVSGVLFASGLSSRAVM